MTIKSENVDNVYETPSMKQVHSACRCLLVLLRRKFVRSRPLIILKIAYKSLRIPVPHNVLSINLGFPSLELLFSRPSNVLFMPIAHSANCFHWAAILTKEKHLGNLRMTWVSQHFLLSWTLCPSWERGKCWLFLGTRGTLIISKNFSEAMKIKPGLAPAIIKDGAPRAFPVLQGMGFLPTFKFP